MNITNCPICGLPFAEPVDEEELRHSYWICECCGCEYGYSDHADYRDDWIRRGAPWFTESARPGDWNLQEQLRHAIPDWDQHPS